MENKFTVDYFIKKFEAIPEEKWCTYNRINHHFQRCAHGHCYIGDPDNSIADENINNEEMGLIDLATHLCLRGFATINNGEHPSYPQPTPKQRILAALYDIKAMQPKEQDAPEKPQEIRYVTGKIDKQVEKLTKELVLN
jgi:hypothetical protein